MFSRVTSKAHICILILACGFASHAVAGGCLGVCRNGDPNQGDYVYRGDTRPPAEIFQNGFVPQGSNLDMFDHLSGESSDSAYVATSADPQVAARYAWLRADYATSSQAYVYEVLVPQSESVGIHMAHPRPIWNDLRTIPYANNANQEIAHLGSISNSLVSRAWRVPAAGPGVEDVIREQPVAVNPHYRRERPLIPSDEIPAAAQASGAQYARTCPVDLSPRASLTGTSADSQNRQARSPEKNNPDLSSARLGERPNLFGERQDFFNVMAAFCKRFPDAYVGQTPTIGHLAAYIVPKINRKIDFFFGPKYNRINLVGVHAEQSTAAFHAETINEVFPVLVARGFDAIDAALVDPTYQAPNAYQVYFFQKNRYLLVRVYSQYGKYPEIVRGPFPLNTWRSLSDTHFPKVDAILHKKDDDYYVFSGKHYAVINLPKSKNFYGNEELSKMVIGPRLIARGWDGALGPNGFDYVTGAVANPNNSNQAYFFQHDRYVLVDVNPGGTDVLRRGPGKISTDWKGLIDAGMIR